MQDAVAALRAIEGKLSLESISLNNISVGNEKFPVGTICTFEAGGKSLSYSLLSIFLQVQDPSITLVNYRHLCKKYKVQDPVKASDKNSVLEYFNRLSTSEEAVKEDKIPREDEVKPRKVEQPLSDHTTKVEKRSEKMSTSNKKKEKTPITQQQIMESLNIVVDKRGDKTDKAASNDMNNDDSNIQKSEHIFDMEEVPKLLSQEDEERKAIQDCLSAAGYEATKLSQVDLENDRIQVDKIIGFEIPVGNSASILRCGVTATNVSGSKRKGMSPMHNSASIGRNFAGVLELYNESLKTERPDKHVSAKHARLEEKPQAVDASKSNENPIIIVPNAMTSPITLINAKDFFERSKFVPRDIAIQTHNGPKPTSVTIKRAVSSRLGGGMIEYEVIDNPIRKFLKAKDWDRVVAVVAQGAGWQFKGWKTPKGKDANPVDVFSNAFGYYIGFDGAPIPTELQGWNCKTGCLSRDKRGLDSVVHSSFWNGLDEWMSVHKSEYLPQNRNP